MRRITMWFTSTAALVALLFSYRTSTDSVSAPTPPLAAGTDNSTSAQQPTANASAAATAPPTSRKTATAPKATTAPKSTAPQATTAPKATTAPNAAPATTAPKPATNAVVSGQTVDTRWGPIQVSITVNNGKITAVSVPVYPNGNQRDQEINAVALPRLVQQTLSAQSAHIDVVSGASVTSDGYITSLQSALDAAKL